MEQAKRDQQAIDGRPGGRQGARTPVAKLLFPLLAGGLLLVAALAVAQDTTGDLPKGIGPISEVILGDIDPDMAAAGEATFNMLCAACHKFGERYVGPDLQGVSERRSPEWIMNMILNTNQMIFEDDTAYDLLAQYMTPMPQLPLTEEQARELLEFFRLQDADAAGG